MASMSFAPHSHWHQPSGPRGPSSERRNSATDISSSLPFNFVPQESSPHNPPTHKRAPPPLPAFSFPQLPEPGPASAPLTTSSQYAGYNKRDSEQNGGETLNSVPSTLSTMPAQTLPNPGPGLSARGPGRRGHAHRRSAAISSVDLTAITKAFPPKPVNGSAPTTPVDSKKYHNGNEDAASLSPCSFSNRNAAYTPPLTPRKSDEQLRLSPKLRPEPLESAAEQRRPLSFVSSEDSMSTVRPRHSRSDSTVDSVGPKTLAGDTVTRPKTAGANFDLGRAQFGDSKDSLTERPRTASASMALSTDSVDVASKLPSGKKPLTARHPLYNSVLSEEIPSIPQRTVSNRKQSKKQKKMRSWAGILTRKGKKRGNKRPPSRRAPTPPPVLTRTNSAMSSLYGVDFDSDNTIVIRTPTDPNAPRRSLPAALKDDTLELDTSWKPQSFYDQGRELDMFSPVIDLDAALGPFNTPEMGSDRPVSGFSAATRRMYSGGRRGEFVGPEMRYHRRAESAPEMPPFDRSGLGLGRHSTAAMLNPDVFDEKEEDEFLAETNKPRQVEETPSHPMLSHMPSTKTEKTFVKHCSTSTIKFETSRNNAGLGIQIVDIADEFLSSNATTPQTIDSCPSTTVAGTPCTPHWDISGIPRNSKLDVSPRDTVEHLDTDPWSGQPDNSTNPTSPPSPLYHERCPSGPFGISQDISKAPLPLQPGVPITDSATPSPAPSMTSFDPPRLATPSSVTDRQATNSVYSGEPGSECFHNSVEDVPSLTSSASTMTGTIPRLSSGLHSKAAGDRCSSFSALNRPRPSSSHTTKRSSLVSLSRLVGVASAEKSKLSYEHKAPTDEVEKKKKKGNRISRLMHFWKSKEKEKQKDIQ
ncbi:predicted protein [Uncinocarpus reesii 1704]|uniref:Cell wall proline rich protein n=1 Tax=Uncinocarpus reesii (strain UAMH 1704) TaxID=336963 RepID=C4JPQ8_UNCRE|nr:uncharacterized protein UREG_04551 [Uncinocarpus reesii 1704]EEP79705.1 predicted protein [Uncinocarpus reesii 1704]